MFLELTVCIGSSCHLKKSREIIQLMEQEIKENNLEEIDKIRISIREQIFKTVESIPMPVTILNANLRDISKYED